MISEILGHRWTALLLLAVCTLRFPSGTWAQSSPITAHSVLPAATGPSGYSATQGHWDVGAQFGYSIEYGLDQHEVSHIQMLIAQPQLGLIIGNYREFPIRRFELIDEGVVGATVHPHVAALLGDALIFRLEGKEFGRWVPFFDAGAGVQHTRLARFAPEVNGVTQFTPQGGFGVEYFFAPQRALVLEWRTVHMSNAGLVPPNMGFNSTMITVGFRWFRRPE